MARGRPRETSGSEKEERRRQQKRDSYERRKVGDENSSTGPQERVDDEDKLEYKARQHEMYEKRKREGPKGRGRPRKEDGDDETKRRREQKRRSMSKTKQKLPLNLSFLGVASTSASSKSCGREGGGEPHSILMKSPKRNKRSSSVMLMSPSKEAQNRAVRPTDDVTPKQFSALSSFASKRPRSTSPSSTATTPTVSPFSSPSTSRCSSPASSRASSPCPSLYSSPASSHASSRASSPCPSSDPSAASALPEAMSSLGLSTPKKKPGRRRKREREPLGGEGGRKKERQRKWKYRNSLQKNQQRMLEEEEEKRSKSRERVAKHRRNSAESQMEEKRKEEEEKRKEEEQIRVALKIVANLRHRLDLNLGKGTMNKEERAFRRLIAETVVGGPEPLSRKEIHDQLGISGHMVAEARRAIQEGVVERDSSSKAVTNALKRKRKTTKFAEKRELILAFYEDSSTPTSRTRDVVRVKINGLEETHQRRFLTDNVTKLRQKFIQQHGHVSTGLFFSLRPKWIVSPKDSDRKVCLCAAHTDVKFAYEDAVSNCKRCSLPLPPYEHYVEFVDSLLCPTEERSRACLKEECKECGTVKLDQFTEQWNSAPPDIQFKFRSIEKDDSGRLGVQMKESSAREFAVHLKDKLQGFALHRWVADNQKNELDKHLKNLNPKQLVLISDFAEKYTLKEWEEVQSMHWTGKLLTLFTSVAFFLAIDPETGKLKKTKVYFAFFSERPEQDHHMVAFCLRRIVLWIKETFSLTFESMALRSDKCAGQFCSRKVFGSMAESRQNLCVEHLSSDRICPNCPDCTLDFSCASHGKCEVDHANALAKTELRKEELSGRPLRNIDNVAAHLQTMNFVDLQKTRKGREDNKGYFYSGFHGEVVNPADVQVSLADWEPIDKSRQLHQLHTTDVPGQLLVRESSCFSCASCEWGDFINCRRTEELGPLKLEQMIRASSKSAAIAKQNKKTRYGQDRHRNDMADLAHPGSVIAIARGQRQELSFILITKSRGELDDKQLLKGKILAKTQGGAGYFSSAGAKLLTFEASIVRSPPLVFEKKNVTVEGKELEVFDIQDSDFPSLIAEYLF